MDVVLTFEDTGQDVELVLETENVSHVQREGAVRTDGVTLEGDGVSTPIKARDGGIGLTQLAQDARPPDVSGKQDALPALAEGQIWIGDAAGNPVAGDAPEPDDGTGGIDQTARNDAAAAQRTATAAQNSANEARQAADNAQGDANANAIAISRLNDTYATDTALANEATARQQADQALGQRIDGLDSTYATDAALTGEAQTRADADAALGARIDGIRQYPQADADKLGRLADIRTIGDRLTLAADGTLSADVQQGGETPEQPGGLPKDEFVADGSRVSHDNGIITITPPGIRDESNILVLFQLTQGVVNAIGALPDAQQIFLRFGDSTVNRAFRALRDGVNVNMTAGDIPSTPIRYLVVTAGGAVNAWLFGQQEDLGANGGDGQPTDLSAYYTKAQTDTAIDDSLDALLGDDTDDLISATVSRSWNLDARAEATGKATFNAANFISETLSPEFVRLLIGGASLSLRFEGAVSASVSGSAPEIMLSVKLTTDSDSNGQTFTRRVPTDAFDFTLDWPSIGIATGDDAYVDVSLTVETRGRSAGTLRVVGITAREVGSHELELRDFVNAIQAVEIKDRERADAALQAQVEGLRAGTLSDTQRRILALLTLTQGQVSTPFSMQARNGSRGGFAQPASPSFDPIQPLVEFRVSGTLTTAQEAEIVVRQNDDAGTPQDYSLRGRGVGNDEVGFIYRITFPNTNELTFLRLSQLDDLQSLADIRQLLAGMADVQGVLSPDARALLSDVEATHTQTSAITRTGLEPGLTLARQDLDAAGAAPALDGGEMIVGVSRARPQQQVVAGTAESLLEAYQSDATRLDLVRMERGANGFAELTIPFQRAAQPAYQANQRVNLFNIADGLAADTYDFRLTDGRSQYGLVREFLVPDGVAANTDATLPLAITENDNPAFAHTFTVSIGGAASGAEQTHDFTRGANTLFSAAAQYVVDGVGRRLLRLGVRPAAIEQAASVLTYGAHYTSAVQVPAVPARVERLAIDGGVIAAQLGAVLAVRIEGGTIRLVLPTYTGARAVYANGEIDTHISADTYGLQSGGTGTIRLTGDYREAIRVTAGDASAAQISALRRYVDDRTFGLGLFSNVASDDLVFALDRAVQAPKFIDSDGNQIGGNGGAIMEVFTDAVEVLNGTASFDPPRYTLPASASGFHAEINHSAGQFSGGTGYWQFDLNRRLLPTAGTRDFPDASHNPVSLDGRSVILRVTYISDGVYALSSAGNAGSLGAVYTISYGA